MKCICTIHTQQLVNWKYSQFHLTESTTGKEACHYLISQRSQLFCNPINQHQQKIGILCHSEQQNSLFQELIQLDLISPASKIFTRVATLEDIRFAIAYTLSVRLAVGWNPVGKWFIHREQQNFLDVEDTSETFQAVQFEIRLSGFHIEVWVCGGELKLYPISPHNLVMNLKDLTHFKEDSNAIVHFEPNPEHRFFYLPKVRIGTLVSVSRNLPESSPFRDYADLCNYWQQQYGYNLPEESTGMVYFNVAFTGVGPSRVIYTYPSCCVFLEPPLSIPISTEKSLSIIRQFWNYLEPLIASFPGQMTVQAWLIDPRVRIPLQEKYAEDLKQDVKMKALIGSEEQIEGVSKYFPQPPTESFTRKQENKLSAQTKAQFKKKTSGSQRITNSTITQYFSKQNPNVKIRRTATKVTFNDRVKKPCPKECHYRITCLQQLLHGIMYHPEVVKGILMQATSRSTSCERTKLIVHFCFQRIDYGVSFRRN